jgi:hypothetical protein
LSVVYQIHGVKQLQPDINVDLEGVKGLLKGLDSEAVRQTLVRLSICR